MGGGNRWDMGLEHGCGGERKNLLGVMVYLRLPFRVQKAWDSVDRLFCV